MSNDTIDPNEQDQNLDATEEEPERERVMLRDYVNIPIKKHPKAGIYSNLGNSTREYIQDLTEFLGTLDPQEQQDFQDGKLILDPADTQSFVDEINVGDTIGLRYSMFKVLDKDADVLACEDLFKKTYHRFDLPYIDASLAMNRGNILYRDGKPYGQPEFETKEVIYHVFRDQLKPGQEDKIVTAEQLEAEEEERQRAAEAAVDGDGNT